MLSNQAVTNQLCPDFAAHQENAAERLIAGWTSDRRLTAEETELVDAAAEEEYRHCEGH